MPIKCACKIAKQSDTARIAIDKDAGMCGVDIVHEDGAFYIEGWGDAAYARVKIQYCPFCGKRLR